MSKKLGYTWYPKDWRSSKRVFRLNLKERGFYRELIDEAYSTDNKIIVELDLWSREFGCPENEISEMLDKMINIKDSNGEALIVIKGKILSIPSCEPRLNLSRGGRNGAEKSNEKKVKKGDNSQPDVQPIPQPTIQPTIQPDAQQIEIESEREEENKENRILINDSFLKKNTESQGWLEVQAMQNGIAVEAIKLKLVEFNNYLFNCSDKKSNQKEYNTHFTNWLKTNKSPISHQSNNTTTTNIPGVL